MLRRSLLTIGSAAAAQALIQPASAQGQSLKDAAAARNIAFGSEVTVADITADPLYAALIVRECAIITPGLEAKWAATEPGDGVFRFGPMDQLAAFALRHGLRLHMHNLIWSVFLPSWVVPAIADGRSADIMARHIAALVGRYQDGVESWDVVNEAADPHWPSGPEGLCNTPWRRALGPDYVNTAFREARAANPHAHLIMNDDDLEYDEPERALKRDIYLRLITALKRQKVPVDGFGLEAHLKPWRRLADKPYRKFLAELAGLGLKIYVTELDVCDRTFPPEIATRDRAVAAMTKNYLDIVLDEPATGTIMTWGLSDRATWMLRDPAGQRPDRLAPRPLPYDAHLTPKPMREALLAAFRNAPARPA
jgi:endo-1,4-beta-xylanase